MKHDVATSYWATPVGRRQLLSIMRDWRDREREALEAARENGDAAAAEKHSDNWMALVATVKEMNALQVD